MDRLTSIDASFLTNETSNAHMHVGAVLIFEGPPPAYDDFLAHVESRLHLVPRFRQKLAFPPVETGRPFWVDDPHFHLAYHVRHSALPAPGSEEQLRNIAARIFSQSLDRSKPLWEMWLVQGLERNRFAIATKTHHAPSTASRVSTSDRPVRSEAGARADRARSRLGPEPPPSSAELAARGVSEAAETVQARPPGGARRDASHAVHGVWSRRRKRSRGRLELHDPAPECRSTPRSAPTGVRLGAPSSRTTSGSRRRSADRQRRGPDRGERSARSWLRSAGIKTEGLELRALVPVSIRAEDEHGQLGNRIAAMQGPLPVYIEDPVKRHDAVRRAMEA
jgi:WS/DGAT/MGAT family acyltransferase